jgi:hypothetical protein
MYPPPGVRALPLVITVSLSAHINSLSARPTAFYEYIPSECSLGQTGFCLTTRTTRVGQPHRFRSDNKGGKPTAYK